MGIFSKVLKGIIPKMVKTVLSFVKTAKKEKPKKAIKGKRKATSPKEKAIAKKQKVISKKQNLKKNGKEKKKQTSKRPKYRVSKSAYGTYVRGVTTVNARYVGHPAAVIPASEMIKRVMEENASTVNYLVQIKAEPKKENNIKKQKEGNIVEYAKKGVEYVGGYYDSYFKALKGEQVIDEKYTLENLFSGNLTIEDIPDIPEYMTMVGAAKGAVARGVWNSVKGTFDGVKMLVTEPGKVWEAVSSGASDFIEHPIQNTKKFVSETYNDIVDAVWRSTPQDMAEDVGEIAGDLMVDALTAGSGAAITTGLKAGAKKLTVRAGKTVTKTVAKTAGKTAIKGAGKKTIKELIPDAKTVKKWVQKELPTDKGWLKNVVTEGGDINVLKKNHYQAIFPNQKNSIKNTLQKTGKNTAKEIGEEFAEDKTVNLAKDKIINETKEKVAEEVKDKAIDVAKDKIVKEVKNKAVEEIKDEAIEEVQDITQKKIVKENSSRTRRNGVNTSTAVKETKVNELKTAGTEGKQKGGDKSSKIKHMSANAREFERLYNEGKINISDFVNECRQIDKVLDKKILENISKKKELISSLFSKLVRKKDNTLMRNFAYADVKIDGLEKKEFFAHSGIKTLDKMDEDVAKKIKDISIKPEVQEFETLHVNTKNIIDGNGSWDRNVDTEFKILEEINASLKGNVDTTGKIILYTDLYPCPSCQYVFKQFKDKYPKIDIRIIYEMKY